MPAAGVAAALRGEHHWRRARGRAKPPRHGYAAAAHGSSASPEAAATAAATADATSDARTGVGTCPAPILDGVGRAMPRELRRTQIRQVELQAMPRELRRSRRRRLQWEPLQLKQWKMLRRWPMLRPWPWQPRLLSLRTSVQRYRPHHRSRWARKVAWSWARKVAWSCCSWPCRPRHLPPHPAPTPAGTRANHRP